jgi:hypothetical protein
MKKRKLWILCGVLLVGCFALSAVMVFRPFEKGPRYKGLPASYWAHAIKSASSEKPGTAIEATALAPSVRSKIERYLGLINGSGYPSILDGDPAAVPVLLQLAVDGDSEISIVAKSCLMKIIAIGPRANDARPFLEKASNSENAAIGETATIYLRLIELRTEAGL